jgi:hypothetical protein
LASDLRSSTVTPKHIEEGLDAMAPLVHSNPRTTVELGAWLTELAAHSDSIIDIARALTLERADPAARDVVVWAEALRACIGSHQRDVELLRPWAMRARSKTGALDGNAIEPESIPALGDMADLSDAIASRDSTPEHEAIVRARNAAVALER